MIETFIFILVLLQIKHWYIDFVNQNEEEVKHKGIYFDWLGIIFYRRDRFYLALSHRLG